MTLSLCMIVKNEAANLPQVLESVQGLIDETLVFDTGSTDNTVKIAQSLGAKTASIPWENDFAAARNHTLEQATGDWVLVLDGDEILTPAARELIQPIVRGEAIASLNLSPDSILAVNLIRQEIGAQQSPYSLVSRLFRNRPEIHFNRPYHETIDDSVTQLMQQDRHWQVVTLPAVAISHSGYQPDAIALNDKFNRAQTTMAAYLATHPNDAYICSKLGALYGQQGDWSKALPLLDQGLANLGDTDDPMIAYDLHYHLGLAHRYLAQPDQAIFHYQQALKQPILEMLKLGAQINLGSVFKQQEQYDNAIAAFAAATAVDPNLAVAHFNLGTVYRAKGYSYLDQAIKAYQRAIQLDRAYAEAYQNLGVALFKLGKLPDSRRAFDAALTLYQHQNPDEAQRLHQGLMKLGLA
ncbi:MAG: tetratricopeptide repeat protein [Cyanobacteria bacterium J06642_9]